MTLQEVPLLTITLQDVLFLIRVHAGGLLGISLVCGAPQIWGRFNHHAWGSDWAGAFACIGGPSKAGTGNGGSNTLTDFYASRCSSVYGASNKIVVDSRLCLFFIKY